MRSQCEARWQLSKAFKFVATACLCIAITTTNSWADNLEEMSARLIKESSARDNGFLTSVPIIRLSVLDSRGAAESNDSPIMQVARESVKPLFRLQPTKVLLDPPYVGEPPHTDIILISSSSKSIVDALRIQFPELSVAENEFQRLFERSCSTHRSPSTDRPFLMRQLIVYSSSGFDTLEGRDCMLAGWFEAFGIQAPNNDSQAIYGDTFVAMLMAARRIRQCEAVPQGHENCIKSLLN